jgi:hypothetical protein
LRPARFIGEFGLGREMPQGNRQPFFNPNNRLLYAGELCFEAIGSARSPAEGQVVAVGDRRQAVNVGSFERQLSRQCAY